MNKRRRIYEGKAKTLYEGPEPGTLIQHFKDDATAFNNKKHALIDGKEATVDDAVEAAADYLLNANMPLVYGMSNITCEAQREAVSLAELVGGVIDSHTSL